MGEIAYVNGRFCAMEEAKVSINDRGLQYGDGVYEVIAAYGGRLFRAEDHLRRLQTSLDDIKIDLDLARLDLKAIFEEGLRRSGFERALIYIQITRGEAPRAHYPPPGLTPTVIITFRSLPTHAPEKHQHGVAVMTTPEIRWAKCYIKATTLLPNAMAKAQAMRQGCYDAIFVTASGEVREATAANVVLVRGGRLIFPARDESILHGVTLAAVIECAQGLGLEREERRVDVKELHECDELFLTSSTEEVLPVVRVNDRLVADGRPGPITRQMAHAYKTLTGQPVNDPQPTRT